MYTEFQIVIEITSTLMHSTDNCSMYCPFHPCFHRIISRLIKNYIELNKNKYKLVGHLKFY